MKLREIQKKKKIKKSIENSLEQRYEEIIKFGNRNGFTDDDTNKIEILLLSDPFSFSQVKQAHNEYQIEHIFESLFDQYSLNYQAQEGLVNGYKKEEASL